MSPIRSITRRFDALARRPLLAALLIGLFAFASAALAAALSGKPIPLVHDEYSYLLAADTFAHGRLANPPHPHWQFFESMHIVHQPAYASMYPPGQGAAIAAGQVLTGEPIVGVWLSVAAMGVAIYWALFAWLPPRWALLGGVLVVLKFVVLGRVMSSSLGGYWSQSYYGGAVAAIGGALLIGALGRIVSARASAKPRDGHPWALPMRAKALPMHAMLLALGVLILAASRPFEGFLLSLPAAIVLLTWFFRLQGPAGRRGTPRRTATDRVIVPAAVVVLAGAIFLGYYNAQVTGSATSMPWSHHHKQYCTFPIFVFQKPDSKWVDFQESDVDKVNPSGGSADWRQMWNHRELARFHGGWEMDLWRKHRSADGMAMLTARKLRRLWLFFVAPSPRIGQVMDPAGGASMPDVLKKEALVGLSPIELGIAAILSVPILALPWIMRQRWMLYALGCCGLIVLGNLITVETAPHYAAPMTVLVVLLIAQLLRRLLVSRSTWVRAAGVMVIVASAASFAIGFAPATREGRITWHLERARVEQQLAESPGNHLVFMRYGPNHNAHNEWVFNAADIDGARIVWARDMGDAKNRQLIEYYQGARKVWLIEMNDDDAKQNPAAYPK